ncbi:hypothetical protein [Thermococcus sp.]|nr:hypothetical protein [Thermococcus sp.]
MKWEVTLHGGKHHGEKLMIEAETVDEARRLAVAEMRRKDARVFEMEKVE